MDDAECSELCSCGAESFALSCHALCVPLVPCRTSLAYYSHAAPAYQAFRGRCLCYSGRFICMRPSPGDYKLPGGVFLLLGYSSTDEALLRPHTNLGVQDAVRALQQYIIQHVNNQVCEEILTKFYNLNFLIEVFAIKRKLFDANLIKEIFILFSTDIVHIIAFQYHRWEHNSLRSTTVRCKSVSDWIAEEGEGERKF